jgi:hypothetical protein
MTAYFFTPLQTASIAPWKPGSNFTIGGYFELTTGLASGDTITFTDAITPSGITAIEVLVYSTQLDSNATPLGAFEFGDSTIGDANAPHRFILAGNMGTNSAGRLVVNYSNVAPAFTAGVQTVGVGYQYLNDENSVTNEPNGQMDLVYTVTTSPATAAATGTVWCYFTYYCGGKP